MSWLCRFIYKLNWHFFGYHSWYSSNFETNYKKLTFIKLPIFFWCSFGIKLSWLQRWSSKINTILYDRCYLQNCKTIKFGKTANQTKYKKYNVPSYLHIFLLNFDKKVIVSSPPFRCWGNRLSKEFCLRKWVISFCLERNDKDIGTSFEWRETWVKVPWINAFSRNFSSINLNVFPHVMEYKSLRENSTSILKRDKAIEGVYRNMKGCVLEANIEGQEW